MKKYLYIAAFAAAGMMFSSCCTVNYMSMDTLKQNYEKKIHHTTPRETEA